ncbi:hypothetical protein WJX77_005374 [Trebouxia sp. C0004]
MHELVLGTSSEWVLKGEGNANAVFGYAGTDPALIGRVVRVRKQPAEAATGHTSDKLTKDLWGPDAEQLSDVSQYFVPALGSKYLATGVQIQLSSDLVAGLNRQLKHNQQLQNQVTLLTLNGSILPDATVFLPTAIAAAATAKVSRFQLQQHLKLAQGKISSISAYDPLDLFSGETVRMHRTLVALIANPQNNLKLFVDGKPVDTLDHTAQLDSTESLVEKAFGLDSDFAEPGNAVTLLADVLKHILLREGVLQKLLSIQALDAHDIEGIYPLYCHMLQQLRLQTDGPNVVHRQTPFEGVGSECELSALQPQKAHVMSLVRKTWSEQISMIRDYLLATTAKDCSLMITMQALPAAASPDHMESQCHCSHFSEFQKGFDLVSVPKIAVQLKYKVAVVDLDVKPHSKILSHYCLDQEIIKHQAMERLIMSDAAC